MVATMAERHRGAADKPKISERRALQRAKREPRDPESGCWRIQRVGGRQVPQPRLILCSTSTFPGRACVRQRAVCTGSTSGEGGERMLALLLPTLVLPPRIPLLLTLIRRLLLMPCLLLKLLLSLLIQCLLLLLCLLMAPYSSADPPPAVAGLPPPVPPTRPTRALLVLLIQVFVSSCCG
ncbi:hypothetical protein NDU88_006926 [Pleurodeles waltl]|uniref:Uncharacterized protein n=1 Tax=Pleurodeles waltl TaxID=8319 RepID=A0AAV7PS24_PLEWA|nr:hypothetical protein NDU88_006926 [Pleurodeles waltl]